jgi:hypothetical protein
MQHSRCSLPEFQLHCSHRKEVSCLISEVQAQLDEDLWAFWALLYWRKKSSSESFQFSDLTDDTFRLTSGHYDLVAFDPR